MKHIIKNKLTLITMLASFLIIFNFTSIALANEKNDLTTEKTQIKTNTSLKVDSGQFTTKNKEDNEKNNISSDEKTDLTTDKSQIKTNTSLKVDSGKFTTKNKEDNEKSNIIESEKSNEDKSNEKNNTIEPEKIIEPENKSSYEKYSMFKFLNKENGFFEKYNLENAFDDNETIITEREFAKYLEFNRYDNDLIKNLVKEARSYQKKYNNKISEENKEKSEDEVKVENKEKNKEEIEYSNTEKYLLYVMRIIIAIPIIAIIAVAFYIFKAFFEVMKEDKRK